MNPQAKNKWLMTVIILLLLANAATLTIFWLGRARLNGRPPQRQEAADYIIKQTGFDSSQERQYRILIKEHQEKAGKLRDEIRQAKDRFFDLIGQGNASDSLKKVYAADASAKTAELDLLTMDHFEKIKALCRPDQLEKFEKVIREAVHMMGPAQPGGRPGPPGSGRPGDGPPPKDGGPDDGPPPGPAGNRPPPPENK